MASRWWTATASSTTTSWTARFPSSRRRGDRLPRAYPIPVPPLAEQHRIVAKVDALMTLCDRLEASLTNTAATRRRLLQALLAEGLAPAGEREPEAAE